MTRRNDEIPYSEAVNLVRSAIEDRATWFDLLTKEAQALGLDPEPLARQAIHKFGQLRSNKMTQTDNMEEFIKQFASELVTHVFEMELVKVEENEAEVRFHYCPLVEAWKKQGNSAEQVDKLCQWACEGDYGLMANFPAFEFNPEKRLAAGDSYCRMLFTRKKEEK